MFSFSSKPAVDPKEAMKEQVRKWQGELRSAAREIDRQIRAIEREEDKVKREIQAAAKKGDTSVVSMLAKHIVKSRGAVSRMTVSKAHLNSISMSLQTQAATMRVAGTMGKSTEVMKAMGRLINAPEISGVMRRMGEEMSRMGIIEEMMTDTLEAAAPDAEADEEEADELVKAVMYEVTKGMMGEPPAGPIKGLPIASAASTAAPAAAAAAAAPRRVAVPEGGADDMAGLSSRLGDI